MFVTYLSSNPEIIVSILGVEGKELDQELKTTMEGQDQRKEDYDLQRSPGNESKVKILPHKFTCLQWFVHLQSCSQQSSLNRRNPLHFTVMM